LCFISDAFHLISSLECLSQFTEIQCLKEHTNIINEKASNFLKLQSSQPAEIQKKRFSALFYLAELAKESDWHTFATELVANYHCQVMQGRGLDPLVSLEGEKIVTTDDLGSYPVKELEKRLLSETVSANSYFVHATAAIYKSVSREVS
jgi:hypothetical protein